MARAETFKTELSRRLRAIRQAVGDPTREDFAIRLGISAKSLGNYERGDNVPDATVLAAYQREFSVDLNLLLSDKPLAIIQNTSGAGKTSLAIQALQQMDPAPGGIAFMVDIQRLAAAIEAVEAGLSNQSVPPGVKAELTIAAYELLTVVTVENRAKVMRLVKGA